jgi:esterase/lipase
MKRIILVSILFIYTTIATAQSTNQTQRREKLEAMRNAYITSQMNLTPEESQKFWPIYNEFHKELDNLERPLKTLGKTIDQMSEEEAKQLIYKELELENKRYTINKKYADKFLVIISAKKLIKLKQAERDFKKMMIEQLKSK